MSTGEVLADSFDRVRDSVEAATAGLDPEQLTRRLDPDANTIAWLVWHLTRIQDDHLLGAAGIDQVWRTQGWAERFALGFETDDNGYGHTSEQVAAVRPRSADLLVGYHNAVHQQTRAFVEHLGPSDLDRVVDRNWDPPVTLGVRVVSVLSDTLQHAGQAAFIRGVIERS
jgi:Protein of unknown function (DUF664)